ncbi:hypothetical protein ABT391_15035 [Streptomyces jumonjinensis]|nr:hypothetical protein [Streptomyces jumonjinensis]
MTAAERPAPDSAPWQPAPEAREAVPPDPAQAAPEAREPAAPGPLGVARTPTGDAGVDALLARLADADRLPADAHPQVYEDVHQGLRETLAALDARPGPVPVSREPSPSPSYDLRS